ncbi:malto-oligosyltrehalose synthase [Chitinophagaceae bacterium LB-8]|uniref:4-alpha-glucanotransferase n=1 Tax=Paraflavisolibacter caeni TaxID=2982496 RepID=A0A9X2XNU6_9BACT|nr:malto-oligosyltrehalose synthase [Paraflavisolibacter caeni]MCU7549673.1 malto-oligosyltrehalose synthase [Paraflavisolibacter caeni]
MYNPVATYRIQFHKNFSFTDLEKIIPYLKSLGIKTIYASPIFESLKGSTHGYDTLNSSKIDPEIGTEEQLKEINNKLKTEGIGWLQDIVPNHMAFDSTNPWIMDVLEKGPQSVYAPYFDITWSGDMHQGRLMVPFLGSTLEDVVNRGELKIAYTDNRFVFQYYNMSYPLYPKSYATILDGGEKLNLDALEQLIVQMPGMKQIEDAKAYSEQWDEFRLQLAGVMKNKAVRSAIDARLQQINKDKEKLLQIAGEQAYRLCHWQEADAKINYRRFFTVNGLICLNIQNEEAFLAHHEYIKTLVNKGIIQGVRVDHIDGLYDPTAYLGRLRQLTGEETYIVVEKILERREVLSKKWPIQGNTGYDFLAMVNNLFTQNESEDAFTDYYQELTDDFTSISHHIYLKKRQILLDHMGGELDNLYRLFIELNLVEKRSFSSIRREDLKDVIAEFLIQCPVYRFYGNKLPLEGAEAEGVQLILNRIRKTDTELISATGLLESVLLHRPHEGNEDYNSRVLQFYQRCMQFTGPLTAKGVEDTLMYTYNRFIGHNEVGDAPASFGLAPDEFHEKMKARQEQWPLSLNATSTHDTKRGEDVRARLNVLTDIPEEWFETVDEWQELTMELKEDDAPDANDEYLIYQTLIGSYPMPGADDGDYKDRLLEYVQKAIREAKRYSNWTSPNEEYESSVKAFAKALLDKKKPFWNSFESFHQRVVDFGIVNSLSQLLLKLTCPGVPDIYQGTDLWDLSLVDPDNRRSVDYDKRGLLLESIVENESPSERLLQELWETRYDGRVKLWLLKSVLQMRSEHPELFVRGDYIPLRVSGAYKNHVFAFARRYLQTWIIIAVPLHPTVLCQEQNTSVNEIDWKNTAIVLPQELTSGWEHLLSHARSNPAKEIRIQEVFAGLPLAILRLFQTVGQRSAGILVHVSSLPSPFGIGDLGPEAKAFASFLYRCHQRFWQFLPLNPTEGGQGHSPYSSISSKAGNTLLISPELLVKDGFLHQSDLQGYYLPAESRVNYEEVERLKTDLFDKAWSNFQNNDYEAAKHLFEQFCEQEKEWLDDFAIYSVAKKIQKGKPWYEWPVSLKQRQPAAIKKLEQQQADAMNKTKWLQFLFMKQWKELKAYCNQLGIMLLGDLPIYVSYDSVDVWSHRDIFSVDSKGERIGMAGVPPDAFSADGQLWGMPVFRWDVLKERGYDWWIQRLKKNKELFDLVRLDHFRAFVSYWEVPAGSETARNGEWKEGPGSDFFSVVQQELGGLPFVAEDLGEVDETVYRLRDEFNLPGMKVLQFAFSEDIAHSPHIPHNYGENFVVYTGTHDNNTTLGWYRQEGQNDRYRLNQYLGYNVPENEVSRVLGRLAYGSVGRTVILPLQDVLSLDESARMNIPSSGEENWRWRLVPGQLNGNAEHLLREWTALYNRM